MGFMGLDNWVGSDNASDLMSNVLDLLGKKLLEHVDNEDNCYNTQGWMDVALIAEAILLNNPEIFMHIDDELRNALSIARKYSKQMLDNMSVEEELYRDIQRMYNNLNTILKPVDEYILEQRKYLKTNE